MANQAGMRPSRLPAISGAFLLTLSLTNPSTPAQAQAPERPRITIAVFEQGMNVLHEDFKLRPGEQLRLPRGVPAYETVPLPREGTFAERLKELRNGALGNMEEDSLYWVEGTRVLVYHPKNALDADVYTSGGHGTGVASAAVGTKYGTFSEGVVVLIHESRSGPAWEWAAQQDWIDIYSTSYVSIGSCPEKPHLEDIVASGRILFAAAGNTVPPTGAFHSPAGLTDAYQVGGVDEEGRSYLAPSHTTGATTTRPYETGDRFDFMAADYESLSGEMDFGGTSGAAPSTAGRAAELITFARTQLGSIGRAPTGELAKAGRGAALPKSGPLADGDLTSEELTNILHHVATPAEEPGPTRYLMEGYGALSNKTTALAKKVLLGVAPLPERPEEDQMHEVVEGLRPVATAGCG